MATVTSVTVQFASPDKDAVDAALGAVRGAPGVQGASTTSLAMGGISVMRVTFKGDVSDLAAALARTRLFGLGRGRVAQHPALTMSQIALPLTAQRGQAHRLVVSVNANAAVIDACRQPQLWPFRTAVLSGEPRAGKSLIARMVRGRRAGRSDRRCAPARRDRTVPPLEPRAA